ncbi:AfsR/SARP family transcriptional regulator [Nocardiopsis sp. MG754419]|uniref:AfsR/SARP family transcriptional regulator n=1 Tax=Nocardiopsis sp. MG754419 TaxID=2259865 RepID=UPI001BA4C1AC|nr:AfsR/SARP family transcriptional regulator [Nocardiopsis sp. MG754419]MBR8740368.1 transcriptional regulator, SARP family protein [Nocardiopsis sp. MG754419]
MLRRLLAVLLCQGGQPLPLDELAEALWEGSPPDGARSTLQVYAHRLRKVLGDSGRVVYNGAGYRIVVDSDEVDVMRFEATVGQARSARRRGELERPSDMLAEAIGLWRGRPYADITNSSILTNEVRRLEELRLLVNQERIEIDLDRGLHAHVVPELTDLAGTHPYRERLLALLMLALYRSGRQAEALGVFRTTRLRLSHELGVEPTPLLQRLHEAILRGDGQLLLIGAGHLDGMCEASSV